MDYDDRLEIEHEMEYKRGARSERAEALQDELRDLIISQGEYNE